MKLKPRMVFEPLFDLFAPVDYEVVSDHMDGLDVRGYFTVEVFKELDEFRLTFALAASAVHFSAARVEGGEELERSGALVFMFAQVGPVAGPGGAGGAETGAGLQACFFVVRQDYLGLRERARVEIDYLLDAGVKFGVPRMFLAEPHVMAPGLQFVALKNSLDGRGRDAFDNAVAHKLAGEFKTIPLRQGAPGEVWPLAGDFDQMDGDFGGKKKAFARAPVYRTVRRFAFRGIGGTIYKRGDGASARARRCARWAYRRRARARFGRAERARRA